VAWQLFGADPRGHHALNVFVHALSAVLAFLFFQRLTGAFWTSALSAALFAWHPLRVESVAWIAERKDVLSVFFGLLTLWAYAVYAEKYRDRNATAWRWYSLALVSFATGLLCKPMLVTLPCVLLLLDVWPLGRIAIATTQSTTPPTRPHFLTNLRTILLEKTPFLALSAGSCYITFLIQKKDGAIAEAFPLDARLANAAMSVIRYLGKFFWPIDLVTPYAHPARWPAFWVISAVTLLLILTGIALSQFRKRPWLLVGWLWFLGMLVPVIGLVQSGLQAMADRYTYLPILGVQVALLWTWGERILTRGHRVIGGCASAIILAVCAALTWHQIGFWSDSITLFDHTLALSENNPLAQSYLGTSLANAGRLDSAIGHYRRSLELDPDYAAAHYGLGVALEKTGHDDEALQHYREAVTLRSHFPPAHYALGLALLRRDQLAEARAHFQSAAEHNPDFAPAQRGLGLVAAKSGKFQEAARCYEKALTLDPRASGIQRDYARALAAESRHTEACAHFQAALRLNPSDATLHYELGLSFEVTNHENEAASCYAEALRLDPAFAEAHYNLGVILINRDKLSEAAGHFRAAADGHPDFGLAYFGLGIVAAQSNQITEAIGDYQKALTCLPDNAEIHNALGHALSLTDRKEDALGHWEQAFKLDPTITGLSEALDNARREIASRQPPAQR
jgi:tetratricopeptide (TPR) repeat protein